MNFEQNKRVPLNDDATQEEQNRLSCLALNETPSGGGNTKLRNKVGKSKSFRDTTGQKKASGGHQRSMSRSVGTERRGCTAGKGCPYRLDGSRQLDSTLMILPIGGRKGRVANLSIFTEQHCPLVNNCRT